MVTPKPLHFGRQFWQGLRDPVLHLHLRLVQIGAELERDRESHDPVGRRLGRHVNAVLDAGNDLFQRRRHRFGNRLGVGARIGGAYDDGGWNDFRVFSDRQKLQCDQAQEQDQQRKNAGEDRTSDEKS